MNDLEICKRIAEIEGISDSIFINYDYNPLTDKALCFDLMIKYNVVFLDGEASVTVIHSCNGYAENQDPQKAICLAIIDSHKEYK